MRLVARSEVPIVIARNGLGWDPRPASEHARRQVTSIYLLGEAGAYLLFDGDPHPGADTTYHWGVELPAPAFRPTPESVLASAPRPGWGQRLAGLLRLGGRKSE